MNSNSVYTTEQNRYAEYEKKYQSRTTRLCIDGKLTGCGNCVGYCQYSEHPGFLTKQLRQDHDCINKGCHYYVPRLRSPGREKTEDISSKILGLAQQCISAMEDLRIMSICNKNQTWVIGYVTVFGKHNFASVEEKIQKEFGVSVSMQRLDYSFERCVELICG